MAKFNKGEWSELLVFLSILFEGKIHAADEDLNKIDEIFYVVLKAIRDNIEYVLENHKQLRINNINENQFVVSTEEFKENKELTQHKVKDLLVAIALGMVPKTKWRGIDEANGGYVIVKPNGDIVCYHIYDRNRLRNYLYKNTKFDSPSSSRTGAGLLVKEEDGVKFRLTCQIRF